MADQTITDTGASREVIEPPPIQSILHMTPHLGICCTHPVPSAWVRFWHWTLLGWTWEKTTAASAPETAASH